MSKELFREEVDVEAPPLPRRGHYGDDHEKRRESKKSDEEVSTHFGDRVVDDSVRKTVSDGI